MIFFFLIQELKIKTFSSLENKIVFYPKKNMDVNNFFLCNLFDVK